MTRAEIIKFLVKECHLSFEEIGRLNDLQIRNLCSKDRLAKS